MTGTTTSGDDMDFLMPKSGGKLLHPTTKKITKQQNNQKNLDRKINISNAINFIFVFLRTSSFIVKRKVSSQ